MDFYTVFLLLSLAAGFFMGFNLGANDVANSMASSVGAKAITLRQALFLAAGLNFVGSVFLGAHVTATISKGIIDSSLIPDPRIMLLGMFAALLSAGLWVLAATLTALPVSSTHSIVGSIMGFGILVGGPAVINWWKMGAVVASWIVSPFFGGLLSFLIFTHIRRTIFFKRQVVAQAMRWAPIWIAATVALVFLSFCYKTPVGEKLGLSLGMSMLISAAGVLLVWYAARRLLGRRPPENKDPVEAVESIFRRMQVGTACYVALSQGANDVANAIGPVAAIFLIARDQTLAAHAEVPLWLLGLGGLGIATGIMLLGHKVMVTMGEKITTLTNTRGFAVEFGAATTVLVASNLGMPVSSTHAAVGSVVGVGLARGFAAVDFRILGKIVMCWMVTVPISAFTCIIIYQLLKWMVLP